MSIKTFLMTFTILSIAKIELKIGTSFAIHSATSLFLSATCLAARFSFSVAESSAASAASFVLIEESSSSLSPLPDDDSSPSFLRARRSLFSDSYSESLSLSYSSQAGSIRGTMLPGPGKRPGKSGALIIVKTGIIICSSSLSKKST